MNIASGGSVEVQPKSVLVRCAAQTSIEMVVEITDSSQLDALGGATT